VPRVRAKFARTSDGIIDAKMNMNLQPQAEAESERRTRSKLETYREAIFALRRKHWSHRQIAEWLNEHGVTITLSSVHRFCQRAIARRPRNQIAEGEIISIPTPQQTTNQTPMQKHRFNLDI
jgi:predicted RNase H-like nuclease (RuvC/YqgF family)